MTNHAETSRPVEPDNAHQTTGPLSITIDSSSIELDNGENLRDLAIGHTVNLNGDTPHPGMWMAAAFHGEYRDRVTLLAAVGVEDCTDVEPGCRYAGIAHAHPGDARGTVYARPGSAV